MTPAIWSRLDVIARRLLPAALTAALVLAAALPLHSTAARAMAPSLPLIAVFFWTLYRPDLMPAVAVFVIGLLWDVFAGLPIGIGATVLVGVHAIATLQRSFFNGKSFTVLWLGFAVLAAAALILCWLMTCLYYVTLITPARVLFQIVTTVGVFPILCWLLVRCQGLLPEQT
ncbi:MAG: rod shape-determining protein MreD [Rhodospirillales bacterium]|nr:rod shape-determining protein MreD [Rhodospirillales bacterium]